ncbi:MAG: 50S ribosomal protein L24, partial [Tissierellia bacterium]|nr:50S ribosomal protein L24 [Tissierellia bacterium]
SGIFKQEGSIHVSNVLLYCPKCKKGVRTGKKELTDGSKVRICSKCGETFDK